MIKIICHRGIWNSINEQNTKISFQRAISNKLGIELDLRDYNKKIIISHDPASVKNIYYFENFLKDFSKKIILYNITLALNIKSDGISKILKKNLKKYNIKNYFVFDMSIPELIQYKKGKINFFERSSNYEKNLIFNRYSKGIWMDNFFGELDIPDTVNKKDLCFVSPECHAKKYKTIKFWKKLKKLTISSQIFICTDLPFLAKRYFDD